MSRPYDERPVNSSSEGAEAPAERPARAPRSYGDRPSYQGGGDRPPYQGGGDRPPYQGGGDRPPYQGGGDRPPYQGGGDRPPYQGGGDRPPYQGGGDRPSYGGGGRRFGGPGQGGNSRFGGRGGGPRRRRQKISKFDEWGIDNIDYKDVERLKEFLSEHAKILSRRVTGSRAKHQRRLTRAIKRARFMALLPYVGKIEKHR
ncbi:30S ribosomal protein S18 [bacterium (Candidatus Blackallbacteria) CG17_big_fil_post_rev_8_21_14_2_50_48_46]|uniref:Small ribosomal subunit protein bS18 n=1 Tax=bacterium (Candidatus Blackallbacteria) CG17_big_fil_post_rev_8_21_14_2_50_48_46 TaxID=2014261 RepID=A0A2M7G6Y1_9BACT|nr:MAG: 30S ribosomal protein S18 [bacterium (Candidatus Blackallbacteria) CG18_big_fil_WC_8_21_14_2_50_49_26]PIW17446.1 MAG: 30S ribosomal protein S18 [bacterium (Candidatus Blackallbacteria) CG17_big_fil_post_rev_8_21_14_2_50_48_46]PIW48300.1 MAG: 30S ribosomal protein S18 [bacterium (Candidatus Blackallbacteria) CG13_big_fil_rev_8_21_14_2_50_49_14]